MKVVSDQLGHSSIVLTADTYISVLPPLALKAAEATAKLIAKAGRHIPGSKRSRRRATPARARIRPPQSPAGATSPTATSSTRPTIGTAIDTPPTAAHPARSRAERPAAGKAVTST